MTTGKPGMRTTVLLMCVLGVLAGCASDAPKLQDPTTPAVRSVVSAQTGTAAPGCQSGYPVEARRAGEQGTVVLRVLVPPSGKAERTQVHRSSGFPRLDQAAVDYAGCLRFNPVQRNGVPMTAWFDVPITFRLEKKD